LKKNIDARRKRKKIENARKIQQDRKDARAQARQAEARAKRFAEAEEAKTSSVVTGISKPVAPAKSVAIEDMNLDTFLTQALTENIDEDEKNALELDENDHKLLELAEDVDEDEEDEEDEDDPQRHQAELDALKNSDPEFYKYMQEHDKELLNFKETLETDPEELAEKVRQAEDAAKTSKKSSVTVVSEKSFRNLVSRVSAKPPTINKLKKIVKIFASACAFGGFADTDDNNLKKTKTVVSDSKAFNAIITFCLSQTENLFRSVLDEAELLETKKFRARQKRVKGSKKSNKKGADNDMDEDVDEDEDEDEEKENLEAFTYSGLSKMKSWEKKWGPIAQVYAKCHHKFLTKLVDRTMIRFALKHLNQMRPIYCGLSSKYSEKILKTLIKMWATSQYDDVSIDAFVEIRGLVVAVGDSKPEILETCLKQAYLAYSKTSRFTTPRSLPRIKFLADCLSKLYALDPYTGYRYAFVYIRQLAIHLRNALISKKTPMNEKKKGKKGNKEKGTKKKSGNDRKGEGPLAEVYNWQFVNGLRVWSLLLSESAKGEESEMRPLVYPFIQVSLGVINMSTSARYWPLHLHVSKFVHIVSRATKTYVPLLPPLLSLLESPEFSKKPTPSTGRPADWRSMIRAAAGVITTRRYQEEAVRRTLALLAEHLGSFAYSIALPELVAPAIARLKSIGRKVGKPPAMKKQVGALAAVLKESAEFIRGLRSTMSPDLGTTPKALVEKGVCPIDTFREESKGKMSPLERYVETLERAEADRERVEEELENQRDNEKKKNKKKKRKKKASVEDENEDEKEDGMEIEEDAERMEENTRVKKKRRLDEHDDDDDEDEDEEDIVEEFRLEDEGEDDDVEDEEDEDDDDDDDDDDEDD